MYYEWKIGALGQYLVAASVVFFALLVGAIFYFAADDKGISARLKVIENVVHESFLKNQELVLATASRIEDSARKIEVELTAVGDLAKEIEKRADTIQKEATRDRARIEKILADRSTALEKRAAAIEQRAAGIEQSAKENMAARREGLAMLQRILEFVERSEAKPSPEVQK